MSPMHNRRGRIALVSCALFFCLPGAAVEINWVDWTDTTAQSGPATVTGSGLFQGMPIDVSYSGSVYFVQLGQGIDFFNPSLPYTDNDAIDNRPPAAELIAIVGGAAALVHTVTFSEPVVDPVMAVVSLGRTTITVTYDFGDETFDILSSGTGYWGGAEPDSLFEVTPSVLTGIEGHGAIQFTGVYSSISWEVPVAEEWHGFTFGFKTLASQDADADGIADDDDNCINEPNGDQRDSNGDGFGNACDPDLNDDLIVNAIDLGLLRAAFFATGDVDADFNGDGVVNAIDLGIMRVYFFMPPGPSGIAP